MAVFEELQKTFEFKQDLYQFANSPLFFLIVVVAVAVFLISLAVIRRRRKGTRKKIRIRKKDDELDEEMQEPEPEKQAKEERNVVSMAQKINYKLLPNECVIIAEDDESVTFFINKDGMPEIKKIYFASGNECKTSQYRDLTTQRKKPEYIPYVSESKQEPSVTERAIPLETSRDAGVIKKVFECSSGDIGDIEREVDELIDLDKKKPNFLSRMAISRGERIMKNKKKEEKPTGEQTTETTDVKRQLTEKEVFEDDENAKGLTIETEILEKEPTKEPQKEDMQPIQQEGESKRQVVLKLLEEGHSKDDILKQTGYDEKTTIRYVKDWTDSQLTIARKIIADGRWSLVKRIIEVLDKKETFLVEDGKLYYPGRDKLTYVFLATTIIFAIVVVVKAFIA